MYYVTRDVTVSDTSPYGLVQHGAFWTLTLSYTLQSAENRLLLTTHSRTSCATLHKHLPRNVTFCVIKVNLKYSGSFIKN